VAASTRTATVYKGTVESRIRVNGITTARNYANITAPPQRGPESRNMTILRMKSSGSLVKKGDVVAELDPQTIKDHIDDKLADLKEQDNQLARRKAEHDVDMENLQQNLRVAKAELDKARLEAKAAEIRTDIDRELLRLGVEEAEARYKELSSDVALKIASQKADMKILEITREMEQQHVNRHLVDLKAYVIYAPMDGMVVLQTINRPGGDQVTIAVGDDVRPGQPLMKIVDSRSMQVEATVNQSESGLFRIGQAAQVGFDAFPGSVYEGNVYAIGALATGSMRQQYYFRTVPLRVQIKQPDAKVIPDLSSSADILLDRAENVVVAPLSAVIHDQGKAFVYVKDAKGFEKRDVTTGLSNGTQIAVLSGLNDKDVVRLN
jgi:multidrug efflux pump subunit AcrA (membrane-fusion protein)